MTVEQKLKRFSEESFSPSITKVNDHIYHFLGYGHSNATAIIANTSVILIDTLDSDTRAYKLKQELENLTNKPVKTIIYTHSHPDHCGGSGAFKDSVEEIISFTPHTRPLQYYDHLHSILQKRGKYQFGYELSDEEAITQGIGIREGHAVHDGQYAILPSTTIYEDIKVQRMIDGITFEFVRTPGEAEDAISVWLEEDSIICTGDIYYGCWPNTYAIRGTQYRDIATWIDSLSKILQYPATILLPGHTKPLLRRKDIELHISSLKEALEYLLYNTLDCMNKGMSMSETIATVKLPVSLKEKDFLKEYYGTIEWTIRSIYQGYIGWFDGNATNLFPLEDAKYNSILLELIGDKHKVKERIKHCLTQQQYQEALQLIDLLSEYMDTVLIEYKKQALLGRAKQMTSANARHYYICSANELK